MLTQTTDRSIDQLDQLHARDVMSSPAIACREGTRVEELAELLADREISGVPVVGEDGSVIGVVSERDIAHALGGPLIRLAIRKPVRTGPFLRTPHAPLGRTCAADVMTQPATVVRPETPLHTVAELMITQRINRVPVVRGDQLKGVVTRDDVLAAVAGLPRRSSEQDKPPILIGTDRRLRPRHGHL